MAIVTFDIEELMRFIGKERPIEEIKDALNMVGAPVDELTDKEITVEVTPDRIDQLTVEGSGRCVANYLEISKPKKYSIKDSPLTLHVDNVPVRPYIVAATVKGVRIEDKMIKSMMQAQEKIHETFGRKRRKVSMGIHDLDKIKPPIAYRAFKYIRFVPLDMKEEMDPQAVLKEHPKGKEYNWIFEGVTEYPFFIDEGGVLSFPPIINSERTRVTEKTENLLIDVTGTSESAIRDVLHVFLTAFYDRGAKIESIKLKHLTTGKETSSAQFERKEKLEVDFLNKTLGMKFKADEAAKLLNKMGYIAKVEGKDVTAEIPPYRADIMHQVDLAEDVAIAYGYHNFKPELPELATIGKETDSSILKNKLREVMMGMGFNEVMTWTLTNEEKEKKAGIYTPAAKIKNPRTTDFTIFRTSLLSSFLNVLAENKTRKMPQRIFEIGRTADEKGNCSTKLCAMITDLKVGYSNIKGVFDAINNILGLKIAEKDFRFLIPGRSIAITDGKKERGWCGEIHPDALTNYHLEYPAVGFEVVL